MKFSIQREVILKPLMQVIGVVERRQTLPVLANLLVNAKDNELSFTGTDLEVELIAKVNLSVDQPGEVTIPARKLVDICKALPDGTMLDIEIGAERATIRGGRSRFTLATLPATEFPVVEDVDVSESVQISQSDFKHIIERSSFAMANQDVRYYLNGLLLELRSGMVRCVATDGHRLSICDADADLNMAETRQIIIPRKGVLELLRLLDVDDDMLKLEFGQSHVRVQLADSVFTSKLIDGRFPDYETVVPIGADQEMVVDRVVIREALQRAAILSNEKYRGVRLELEPGRLRIVAHNPEQEEAVEEMAVETEIEKLAVGFNVNYLLEALNALDDEQVKISFRDANSSCLVQDPDSDHARHVVMPLRL
jgi:DNA polymerase-3 subunit beta